MCAPTNLPGMRQQKPDSYIVQVRIPASEARLARMAALYLSDRRAVTFQRRCERAVRRELARLVEEASNAGMPAIM